MKIGELADRTGTNVETIRYYERIGMIPAPGRTGGNYRDYDEAHAKRLAFVRHARGLGFELADIRVLLDLSDQPDRDCAEADRITSGHLQTVDAKIAQLQSLRSALQSMLVQCAGGSISECRIIEALSDHARCGHGHSPHTLGSGAAA